QEIALDAVQAAVDLRVHVAVGGHHAVVAHGHVDAAAGAAVAAGRLAPLELGAACARRILLDDGVVCAARQRQSGRGCGGCDCGIADEFTARGHVPAPVSV